MLLWLACSLACRGVGGEDKRTHPVLVVGGVGVSPRFRALVKCTMYRQNRPWAVTSAHHGARESKVCLERGGGHQHRCHYIE